MVDLVSAASGERFRLGARVADGPGFTLWRATDALLERTVAILTLVPGCRHERTAIAAACAASRLNDPRFATVFDADISGTPRRVITEWPAGESFDALLRRGPLVPADAVRLVGEVARALVEAHTRDLSHLRLTPRSLVLTPTGSIKILGLGVAAALEGVRVEDPALADAQGLARLLYAAVTGCRPGNGGGRGLPLVLAGGSGAGTIGRMTAGVPRAIGTVIQSTLAPGTRAAPRAIGNPAESVEAIAEHRRQGRLRVAAARGVAGGRRGASQGRMVLAGMDLRPWRADRRRDDHGATKTDPGGRDASDRRR